MADSLDNAGPLGPPPADTDYRVMPRVREQDRERRFDSLFQEKEESRKKPDRELEQTGATQGSIKTDTFERHNGEHLSYPQTGEEKAKGPLGQNLDISA
ncbi:MAG: hypothetical protein ACUVTG_04425 [Candidatus Oleimicrobiaceae bacterium]